VAEQKEEEQEPAKEETTLVERWLQEQQQWQKTAMNYLDSMAKSDEFLVHLGNAMRGSLLAGKPYPTESQDTAAAEAADDRIDEVLFALHKIEGQIHDLKFSIDELRAERASAPAKPAGKKSRNKLKPLKPKGNE